MVNKTAEDFAAARWSVAQRTSMGLSGVSALLDGLAEGALVPLCHGARDEQPTNVHRTSFCPALQAALPMMLQMMMMMNTMRGASGAFDAYSI